MSTGQARVDSHAKHSSSHTVKWVHYTFVLTTPASKQNKKDKRNQLPDQLFECFPFSRRSNKDSGSIDRNYLFNSFMMYIFRHIHNRFRIRSVQLRANRRLLANLCVLALLKLEAFVSTSNRRVQIKKLIIIPFNRFLKSNIQIKNENQPKSWI